MESKSEIALAKFSEGYNCAQSVFYSFCDELQFDRNEKWLVDLGAVWVEKGKSAAR
jgi:hypothetical protein